MINAERATSSSKHILDSATTALAAIALVCIATPLIWPLHWYKRSRACRVCITCFASIFTSP